MAMSKAARVSTVVAVGAAAVVAFLLLGDSGSDPPSDPFAGVPLADEKPGLTDPEQRDALRIIREDPLIDELLSEREPDLGPIGPWGERDAQGRRRSVGALVQLRLAVPRDFAMRDWPVVHYEPGEDCDSTGEHYRELTAEYAAANATGLQVSVDLNKARVVGVEPTGGQALDIQPGRSLTTTAEFSGC